MSNQKNASLDIVFVGPPGSGKGTQATQLCQRLNLPHIATGDLFRENLKNETDLGKLAKSYMNRGDLVPDDVTEAMVKERLSRDDTSGGFILDGFPRNLSQAETLTKILADLGRHVTGVFLIKVPDENIVNRLSGRMICRECQAPFHNEFNPFKSCPTNKCKGEHLYQRDDDNPDTIRTRLKTYHGQTVPLIDYYREAGVVIEIEGVGEVSEITNRISSAAESLKR
jgi:adenylate kinase